MKFQQGYLGLSMHIQLWLTHRSWESRKKHMHGSFLSSSLKAQLQTPLHVCISVIEDECIKKALFLC